MNTTTFKPGDTVRREPGDRTPPFDRDYVVDRQDGDNLYLVDGPGGIYNSDGPWSAAMFELVAPAAAAQATTTLDPAAPSPGLYRDVDGRGWLHDDAGGWHPVSTDVDGGVPVDPTPIDDGDGWWDIDYSGFDDQDRATLRSFGLQVRVQVRRAAR